MDDKKRIQLEEYYNHFCEDKRLDSRHGNIEFVISMKYIKKYLDMTGKAPADIKIADIGAGPGRYAIPLAKEGYDVTAIDLSPNNIGLMKHKSDLVKASLGNALDLKLPNDTFDLCLLFGPLYHLNSRNDKLKALSEAKRITKPGGTIMAAYVMNEYAVLTYGIAEGHILEALGSGELDEAFHVTDRDENLYSFVRLEDIDSLNAESGLIRQMIFSPDGPANHMRIQVNRLTTAQYEAFIRYQMSVCERPDLLGASAHTVDVLKKPAKKADI